MDAPVQIVPADVRVDLDRGRGRLRAAWPVLAVLFIGVAATVPGSHPTRVVPRDERGTGQVGSAAALSADGQTALVGGPSDNGSRGAAWVFTRSGSSWIQQGPKLIGGAGTGDFGSSVALSADGDTALVGSPESGQGVAYVFSRRGSSWVRVAKLRGRGEGVFPRPATHAGFGASVALSGAGDVAMVGGPQFGAPSDQALSGPGAVWVFALRGSRWTETQRLTVQGPNLGNFGGSVALSTDGRTALISSSFYHSGKFHDQNDGTVWVFARSGSTWKRQGPKLTGRGESHFFYGAQFGGSLAVSADGDIALIGGPADNPASDKTDGAAWVFARSHGVWTQQGGKLSGTGQVLDMGVSFGASVALSASGDIALIGGPDDNTAKGAVWLYRRAGSVWTQEGKKIALSGPAEDAHFGTSVALTADGRLALIGGPGDSGDPAGTPSKRGGAWLLHL